MKSISLFTEEMDDLEAGVADLAEKLGDFQFLKNSVGIVHAHPDTDFEELLSRLKEQYSFPIVGTTAMSMVVSGKGFATQGINFMVLTADDAEFSAIVTDTLEKESLNAQVAKAYKTASAGLQDKPKLIFAYTSSPATSIGDDYVEALTRASGGDIPVFGAMSSDDFSFDDCRVFCDNEIREHGVAMILVSGNIRPIIEYEFSVSEEASFSAIITEAKDNIIYKLGDKTFVEAVREAGILISNENSFNDCIGTPFILTYINEFGDELTVMRSLVYVNEDGSATFKGRTPVGARVHIGLINRTDVHNSVAKVIKSCYKQACNNTDNGEYQYSTVIMISCASRLMTFANDIEFEANEYVMGVPDTLSIGGIYSFGEVCPTKGDMTGRIYNTFLNSTFTLLVL